MSQTHPDTMQAAAIDEFGGPITPHTLPVPSVDADEVLIRVESAGVGVWDPFEREGGFAEILGSKPHFPYVLGSDGAGTIVEVGSKVKSLKPGDHVYALALLNSKGGFYAQYAALKADGVSPIPGSLTVEEAGALPVDAVTALCGLDESLRLKQGESILILGASGGIGHLAVQLAKRMGARVFAVASGQDGVALVRQLGADTVIDGHSDDLIAQAKRFAPDGIDTALITAGGKSADAALQTLRQGGRAAYPHGVEPEPKPRPGITLEGYDGRPNPQLIKNLNKLIEQGPFEVHIAQAFPLAQAAKAQQALEQHYLGKLVLRPV
jgi:NADPH:quinone reductase-like Zn-dependent oxidoreductase